MTQVRQVNPIIPGRYWYTAIGSNIALLDEWLKFNRPIVKVRVTSLETSKVLPPDVPVVSQFVIFEVLAPAFGWDPKRMGFPSDASDPKITSQDDVDQAPDVPEPGIPELFEGAKHIGLIAAIGLVGVIVYKVVRR